MTTIHKEIYGQGKPIVLIHGWAMHTGVWRLFAQQLAMQYRVICLDLPGHGLSENIEPYTLEQIAKILINEIPDPKFSVLGWSLGASIGIGLAKQFPDRIESLILLAGNPQFVKREGWLGMEPDLLAAFTNHLQSNYHAAVFRFLVLQVKGLADNKLFLKQLKKSVQERELPSKRVLQNALKLLQSEDLRHDLASLHCSINIILGDIDALIPVEVGLEIQQLHLACKINIIHQAGHVPFLSHQSQVVEIINNIL